MNVEISRILHAGYLLKDQKTEIVFDPIFENPFSRNCHAFPEVEFDLDLIRSQRFSAVFISHYHDDHCSFESLNLLNRQTPIYLFCVFDELFSMIRELGFENVHSLEIDQSIQIGDFEITPRRALDEDVDSIFQIKVAGLNILNVVDSWIGPDTMEQLEKNKPWDLILWPFQTMREIEVLSPTRAEPASQELPPEWTEQLKILEPRFIVPSSCQFQMEPWSWYNQSFFPVSYRQFEKEMNAILPQAQVIRLNPGVSISLSRNEISSRASLSWIRPCGDQGVDYVYNSNLKPPKTAEIAQHFEPLTKDQNEIVLQYCQSDLLAKYTAMELPEDSYFEEERLWRLTLSDPNGQNWIYFYKIHQNQIRMANPTEGKVAWSTEVPISRLYGALANGESLTSMYIRVNAEIFEPEIEEKIQKADVMEDPLIRCLFTGVFGAYQKSQLQQIRSRNAKP